MKEVRQKYLTPEQLALRIGKKVGTLKLWRSKKIGPPFLKIKGRVQYEIEQVEAWERENTKAPAEE